MNVAERDARVRSRRVEQCERADPCQPEDGDPAHACARQISDATAKRFDHDLAAVPDSFLAAFRTMARYQQLGTSMSRVPPAGVPAVIVCEPADRNLSCEDLNGDQNAAVGSGIYTAVPEPGWRPAPKQQPDPGWALEVAILGHPPTAAELRLEEDLLMAATESSSTTTTGHAQRVPAGPQSR
jgi:hypothetical protein